MKVLIFGLGSWGTALGQVLTDNNNEVYIYGIDKNEVDELNNFHTNSKYFSKDIKINPNLKAVNSYQEYVNYVDTIVIAVPSKAYDDVLYQIKEVLKKKIYIVSVGKGFDLKTEDRLSNTIRNILPNNLIYPIVSLIGPSHAEEVIIRMLTCITSTCLDFNTAKLFQEVFSNNYFRVYTNLDELGAEYAAAIKNVIAIGSGILTGLGYGDNTKAAFITRGLAEMVRFGTKLGGKLQTYLGLTGIGDLLVTCNSYHSRNFQAGLSIGKANSASEFLKNSKMTVEGIRTSLVIHKMSKQLNIDMPICEGIYQTLYENKAPSDIINMIMNRPLKNEF